MSGGEERRFTPDAAGRAVIGGVVPPDGSAGATGMAEVVAPPPDLDTEGPRAGEKPNQAPDTRDDTQTEKTEEKK